MKLPLSVAVITHNEAPSIARTLASVAAWAGEMLVVDSESTDDTREIAASCGAHVLVQPWLGYGQQKNFASQAAQYDWVFSLDGDEEVSGELAAALQELFRQEAEAEEKDATKQVTRRGRAAGGLNPKVVYAFARKNYFGQHWIRYGGWYPNYTARLGHRAWSRWSEPFVHETLQAYGGHSAADQALLGRPQKIAAPLIHHTFASLEEQVRTNLRFARLGAQDLLQRKVRYPRVALVLKPLGKFVELFWLKRGFLDGWDGWLIAVNAAYSMFLKYAFLREYQNNDSNKPS